MVTNSVTFNAKIHEEPNKLLDSLLGDQMSTTNEKMYQEVVQDEIDGEIVTYWGFMLDKVTSCSTILRLVTSTTVQDHNEIRIAVSSVVEEELEETTLPSPHPAATKTFRLLFNKGTIILRPLPFGQTSFNFTALASLGIADEKDNSSQIRSSSNSSATDKRRSTKKLLSSGLGFLSGPDLAKIGFGVVKAEELFNKIALLVYERFEKKAVIDQRMKQHFIANIPIAPALTLAEEEIIKTSVNIANGIFKAKRITGTVNDLIEKFLYRDSEGGAAWGMTKANVDVAAITLFTELWLLDTYDHIGETKSAIREVWKDLDGTRGLQYTTSVSLPSGFKDRLFETWITWAIRVDAGRRTFIIAISPIEEYEA
ncbi:hypothetical protein TrST_g8092 [Triparma strigata]|uniref:Uncharacterized protein n=1 Tax=Triparma strigata TaxID=1606541 RepID=A0A9W6ZMR0_9STRA|nr:hypothetical protein TrST_g8092 [Triparma strigata]